MRRTISTALLIGLIVVTPLWGHETGAIRLKAKEVPAGGKLEVRGEKLPKDALVKVTLKGALATHNIAEIRTTPAGTFDTLFTLPAAVTTGAYSVIVLAADGDAVARADLTVTAATPAHDMAAMQAGDSMPAGAAHPTAAMMDLDTNRSGVEWGIIATIIAASFAGGVVLLVSTRNG